MTETRIDELLNKADSKFAMVVGAAKRTRQITDFLNAKNPGETAAEGSVPPPVSELMIKKPLIIAIDEIADGKIKITYKEPSVEEPVDKSVADGEPKDDLGKAEDKAGGDEDAVLKVKAPEETMEEGSQQEPIEDALKGRPKAKTPDES
ncbi:MAG: DNA-directed RNA polymerase subunit omega [Actinomycetota bacterium]